MMDLTRKEAFLLDWLRTETSSPYDDVRGPELATLLDLGLAVTTGYAPHDRVRLTHQGDCEAGERARVTAERRSWRA
jgi:hypothetical protein